VKIAAGSFASRCQAAHVQLISREVGYGITDSNKQRVEAIWYELAQQRRQPRFEKTILNVLDFSIDDGALKIACGLMPYRFLVGRLCDDLSSIKPLALTGITERAGTNELLIGKRALDASSHGGWYETTPSGGVELEDVRVDGAVDILHRVYGELFEEAGIPENKIESSRVFGFYYDAPTGTLDIIIRLAVGVDQLILQSTAEYGQLNWLPPNEVSDLLDRSDIDVVDVSRWAMTEWLDTLR
jgi:hypothetical protein